MNQYKGAVFYVDMLGIEALTRKRVELSALDYKAWGIKTPSNFNEHRFCAKLLMKFRSCLGQIKNHYATVNVAQLSDCAFIWSKDVVSVVEAAQEFMLTSVKSGLLCRGGIAYGEIVEPDKIAHSLGHFVLGEAATMAVELEGAGKGCRVFASLELAEFLFCSVKDAEISSHTFDQLKNPLNGSIVDEFCWYRQCTPSKDNVSNKIKLKKILELLSLLRHSPAFNWNAFSDAGRSQLACSIESISSASQIFCSSDNYVFSSDFARDHLNSRSTKIQKNVFDLWSKEVDALYSDKTTRA